jgi:hypothetical protein
MSKFAAIIIIKEFENIGTSKEAADLYFADSPETKGTVMIAPSFSITQFGKRYVSEQISREDKKAEITGCASCRFLFFKPCRQCKNCYYFEV